MKAYSRAYLDEVVENQGKLFDNFASTNKDKDTKDFINAYMSSETRKYIDESQPYVNTMDANDLYEYFIKTDNYKPKKGESLKGFLPDWIGEFYAYYQWFFNMASKEVIKKVPLDFLIKAYPGLHDLDLELAVLKVGN